MDILIATNNAHKMKEFTGILKGHRVMNPRDLGLDFDHDETGNSFFENSYGKANSLFDLLKDRNFPQGRPAILADDSGIVVPALHGEPGIYSARYGSVPGGPELTDQDRNALLLQRLRGQKDRSAHYVCCMVLLFDPERFSVVQETWEGQIHDQPSLGTTGFGYDPIFWLPEYDCTVADIHPDLKSELSHRAKASRKIVRLLEEQ